MRSIETVCVHPLEDRMPGNNPVTSIISPSTAYNYLDNEELVYPGFFSTYNQKRLADIMVKHEGGEWALIFNSGMAAICTAILAFARKGDHIILSRELYGGTINFVSEMLPYMGIRYDFADASLESYQRYTGKNTRLIFLETPSNPLLTIVPLGSIARWAQMNGIITIVDNTLATSVNQKPLKEGCDISIQSGTKYLGGHNDLQFGTLVVREAKMKDYLLPVAKLKGNSLSPDPCYKAERSLKTLALRIGRQNENAMNIAHYLEQHPGIEKVYYPGLKQHEGHEIACRQMTGFGGMVSFLLKANAAGIDRFLRRLRLVRPALSLGGVESLICVPAKTSHSSLAVSKRKSLGIRDNLLRLSVGIEFSDDIISDLDGALTVVR